jgi:hypothetical protein
VSPFPRLPASLLPSVSPLPSGSGQARSRHQTSSWSLLVLILSASPLPAAPGQVIVKDAAGLRRAMAAAGPGTTVLLEPGSYGGGFSFARLRGEKGKPIVIAGRDPKQPPLLGSASTALHLRGPRHVELRDLAVTACTGNGINIDDAGSRDDPAFDVVLRRIRVSEIGPEGNRDGLKMSGVKSFLVADCLFERWGSAGAAIDIVGCHDGVIEGCTFRGAGSRNATGVQLKGGTSRVAVRANRFEDAGGRGVNIGGSTGLEFFRPQLELTGGGPRFAEAREITVEGNTFIGGEAAFAFTGVDGAVVRFNTIYRPRRWLFRILQENRHPEFLACRGGVVQDNLLVFRADEVRAPINIGPGTEVESFRFARNFWYCIDRPERSRPDLPTPEEAGTAGKDPCFLDPDGGNLELRPESPARSFGAEARRPRTAGPRERR